MLKNREGPHSDDAVKKGGMNCDVEKLALCIAAFRVAALWCTENERFPFFPRDFRASAQKNPCFLGWFSLLFPKSLKARKGRSG